MKTCNKCKGEFPATREHFYADNRNTSRLQAWCKKCMGEYAKERSRKKVKEARAETPKAARFRIGQGVKVGQRHGRISGVFKYFVVVDFQKYKESFLYTNIS